MWILGLIALLLPPLKAIVKPKGINGVTLLRPVTAPLILAGVLAKHLVAQLIRPWVK